MALNQYIGARYVPLITGEWDATISYEPLSVVLYQGSSYTSICSVPIGIPPTNTAFWALTGNYNAQVEEYRKETQAVAQRVEEVNTNLTGEINTINTNLSNNETSASLAKTADIAKSDKGYANVGSLTNYYFNNARVHMSNKMSTEEAEYTKFGIQSANGYLIPEASELSHANSGNALSTLACMGTFLNKGITYGHYNGVFNTGLGVLAEQMVCSDYVFAGLLGMIYDGSKFVGRDNTCTDYACQMPKSFKSQVAPTPKDALITRELAMIYAGAGRLYKLTSQFMSNVMVGDILFYGDLRDTSASRNDYLGINHCAVVVNVKHEGGTVDVLECGSITELLRYCYINQSETKYDGVSFDEWNIYTTKMPEQPLYVARPSHSTCAPRKIYTNSGKITYEMGATPATAVVLGTGEFKKGDLVEIKFNGNFNQNPLLNAGDNIRWYINEPSPSAALEGNHINDRISYNIPRIYSLYGFILEEPTDYSKDIKFSGGTTTTPFTLNADYELNVYRP
jgi:hypothetical protein